MEPKLVQRLSRQRERFLSGVGARVDLEHWGNSSKAARFGEERLARWQPRWQRQSSLWHLHVLRPQTEMTHLPKADPWIVTHSAAGEPRTLPAYLSSFTERPRAGHLAPASEPSKVGRLPAAPAWPRLTFGGRIGRLMQRESMEAFPLSQWSAAGEVPRQQPLLPPVSFSQASAADRVERGEPFTVGTASPPFFQRESVVHVMRHGSAERSNSVAAPHQALQAPPLSLRLEPSVGESLPPVLRRRLEKLLGFDPGGVRLHTGSVATQAAASLRAAAFTVGSHIFFAAGRFNPATRAGLRLLTHELTHVRQQPPGRPFQAGELSPSQQVALEAEARANEAIIHASTSQAVQPWPPLTLSFAPLASPAVPMMAPQEAAGVEEPVSAGEAEATAAAPPASPPSPDPELLAEEVYRLLQQRLRIERERRGLQWIST
jgi:hypothetical protein